MNKILSARIDDAVFRTITDLSQKMHSSKKAVIEKAINLLRENVDQCKGTDCRIRYTEGIFNIP